LKIVGPWELKNKFMEELSQLKALYKRGA
jgi:hypothetical protein